MLRRPRHLGRDAAAAPVFSVTRHFEPADTPADPSLPFAVTRLDEMLPVDEEFRQDDLRRLNQNKNAVEQGGVWFTEILGDYIHLKQALLKLFFVILFFKYVHTATRYGNYI